MKAVGSPATRKRWTAAILVLAILLTGADAFAWLQMQRLLDRRLDRLVRDAARAGWQLQVVSGHRGGWPLAASLTLLAPRLHGADQLFPGGITWSGDRVTASLSLLHPTRVTILPRGTQMISTGGTAIAGSLRFWSADTALRLPPEPDGANGQVLFDAEAVHVALPGAGPDDVLTIAGLRGSLRWTAEARALAVTMQDIGLPPSNGVTAGDIIPHAALEASLAGALHGEGGSTDGSGRLLLRQAELSWDGAKIEASGRASLDGNFQPIGSFFVRIEGGDTLLDTLAQSGRLTPGAANAVRAVLGLVAAARDNPRTPAAGNAHDLPALELPLLLRGDVLSLGQIPLLRIPLPALSRPATLP
jgi:uncharacterized protein DUF2125